MVVCMSSLRNENGESSGRGSDTRAHADRTATVEFSAVSLSTWTPSIWPTQSFVTVCSAANRRTAELHT